MNLSNKITQENTSVLAAAASAVASIVAGLACIGPMLGIALGVGGLGWLSQYSYLTIPASILSILLLIVAQYLFLSRKTSCTDRKKHRMKRFFLIVATLIVVTINSYEFLVLPNLY